MKIALQKIIRKEDGQTTNFNIAKNRELLANFFHKDDAQATNFRMAKKRRFLANFLHKDDAQATVELAVMFPVVLIIAVIAVNVILYFNHCAMFDRVFNQSVTMLATSPAYGQTLSNSKSLIENELRESFENSYLSFDVSVTGVSGNLNKFNGTLKMHPTLFGMGLRDDIFGVPLPTLNHSQEIVIDVYKPGVIF